MQAAIITIGTELLIGQIIDTNSAYLGQQLNELGIDVNYKVTIADLDIDIKLALENASERADIIFITGGLGPTKDDITKESIASFLGREMYFDKGIYTKIQEFFRELGRPIKDSHKQQCYFPKGVVLLNNKLGTAPGMLFKENEKMYFSMPGVPYEMKSIFSEEIIPILNGRSLAKIYHRTILTSGIGETDIENRISYIVDRFPSHISIAYLPSLGSVRVRLTGHSNDKNMLEEIDTYVDEIVSCLEQYIVGTNGRTLEEEIAVLLQQKKWMFATAESCTGGRIASKITEYPGASGYYAGSVVSYSNETKIKLLNVSPKTLDQYGAVSEQTVIEMLQGVLRQVPSDVAISVSGIAGPDGGTKDKPVGTVWMAVGNKNNFKTKKIQFGKHRNKNIEYSCHVALDFLRKFILGDVH